MTGGHGGHDTHGVDSSDAPAAGGLFHWRGALVIGAIFIVVGAVYLFLTGNGETMDRTGATLFVVLGVAMAFAFTILLRGSREL